METMNAIQVTTPMGEETYVNLTNVHTFQSNGTGTTISFGGTEIKVVEDLDTIMWKLHNEVYEIGMED